MFNIHIRIMFYFALFLSQHVILRWVHQTSVCYFSELRLPNGMRHSPEYHSHRSMLVEAMLMVMLPVLCPSPLDIQEEQVRITQNHLG